MRQVLNNNNNKNNIDYNTNNDHNNTRKKRKESNKNEDQTRRYGRDNTGGNNKRLAKVHRNEYINEGPSGSSPGNPLCCNRRGFFTWGVTVLGSTCS